jgi:bifunctional DNA-binding transcriptional regulator/antitoxin component of YhaV-PrlF toxin-antitoxin module
MLPIKTQVKTTKLSSKSQLTLPKPFLQELNFKKGDFVKVFLDTKNQNITLKVVPNPIKKLKGILKISGLTSEKFLQEKKQENLKNEQKQVQLNPTLTKKI